MDQPTDKTTPNPKRFYWLKRLSLAALLLVILLVGLRLVWGHRVQSRLDQAIADIHAKGEPILFDDLQREPLANDENGAWYLTQALQQWPGIPGQPGVNLFDTDWYTQGEEAGFTDPITNNAAYLQSCQAVLNLIRKADQCSEADWGIVIGRPLWNVLLPHLGNSRELSRLLEDAGYRALELGDIERVFEFALMQHTIARHIGGESIFLIDSLVAIANMDMGCSSIERALPQINSSDLREGPARELAKQMIVHLTDDTFRDNLVQGLIGERASNYDVYECLIDGTSTAAYVIGNSDPIEWIIDTPGFSHAYRPALKHEQYETSRFITTVIEQLRNGQSASRIQQLQDDFQARIYNNRLLYPLQGIYFGAYASAARSYYRYTAKFRCAAAAIAIKLYEADHGKRPDTLEQLVPDYLPAVPTDPFSTTGEPIRYNPVGIVPTVIDAEWLTEEQLDELKQRSVRPYPVLYSIGEDDKSQGGGPLYLDIYGHFSDTDRFRTDDKPGDIWFLLDAWPEAVFDESDIGTDAHGRRYEEAF